MWRFISEFVISHVLYIIMPQYVSSMAIHNNDQICDHFGRYNDKCKCMILCPIDQYIKMFSYVHD